MTNRVYFGNTPLFYQPKNIPRMVITAVAFIALGVFAGWGYAFAFLAGGAVWSISID